MRKITIVLFMSIFCISGIYSQYLYLDFGAGIGSIKHTPGSKFKDMFDENFTDEGGAVEYGGKMGFGLGQNIYIIAEFDYLGREYKVEGHDDYDWWKTEFNSSQYFVAPGIIIYLANHIQLATSYGITFGSWESMSDSQKVSYGSFDLGHAYNISFAIDMGRSSALQLGVKYHNAKNKFSYNVPDIRIESPSMTTSYIGAFLKYRYRNTSKPAKQTQPAPITYTYTPPVTTQQPVATAPVTPRRTDKDVIETGVKRAIQNVPVDSRILIEVTASATATKNKIIDEIEDVLLEKKYRVVTRGELDIIRKEQNLQISGDVDEDTAVEIGRFAGASYIMTVRVEYSQVRIRILNVQTSELIGSASESY